MDSNTLTLNTFNCRGLANASKRRTVMKWLKQNHFGFILLQETHSTIGTENEWT